MLTSKAFPPRIALHEVAHRVASTWAVPKHLLVSGLSLALSLGIGDGLAYAAPAAAQQAGYVPGRLLIQQRAGLSEAEMDNALKPHGGKRGAVLRQAGLLPDPAREVAADEAGDAGDRRRLHRGGVGEAAVEARVGHGTRFSACAMQWMPPPPRASVRPSMPIASRSG